MGTEPCVVCGGKVLELASKLCASCVVKAGMPPPGPPLRRPIPCERCGHAEIVRVRMRERTSTTGGDANEETARPFALTWSLGEEFKSTWSMQKIQSARPKLDRMFGLMEAYVCRACGATELFTRNPGDIPIGPEFGTELIVAGSGPYR